MMSCKYAVIVRIGLLYIALLALQACSPALTTEGVRVQAVSKEFAERCEHLGMVEGVSPIRARPKDTTGHTSVNRARNRVAALGGDAMVVRIEDRLMTYGRAFRYVTRVEALQCGLSDQS